MSEVEVAACLLMRSKMLGVFKSLWMIGGVTLCRKRMPKAMLSARLATKARGRSGKAVPSGTGDYNNNSPSTINKNSPSTIKQQQPINDQTTTVHQQSNNP